MPPLVLLAYVVFLAFVVEATLGFGGTVVTVALGAALLPISKLLPAFIPLNLMLSAWLAVRGWAQMDRRLLFGRIVPWMAVGLPFGLFALARVDEGLLVRLFGAFVFLLAGIELSRRNVEARPLPPAVTAGALAVAGVIHGAFATGGPLVVWVVGRTITDKAVFRSTLAGLWFVMNATLLAGYAWSGALNAESVRTSAVMAPGLVAGLVVGELIHTRVDPQLFRRLVFMLLGAVGVMLVTRSG